MGTDIVLRDASAVGVRDPEVEHGDGMASLGSPLKPDYRLTIVLRYASAVCVVVSELKRGDGVTLVYSLPKPSYCLGIVPR